MRALDRYVCEMATVSRSRRHAGRCKGLHVLGPDHSADYKTGFTAEGMELERTGRGGGEDDGRGMHGTERADRAREGRESATGNGRARAKHAPGAQCALDENEGERRRADRSQVAFMLIICANGTWTHFNQLPYTTLSADIREAGTWV